MKTSIQSVVAGLLVAGMMAWGHVSLALPVFSDHGDGAGLGESLAEFAMASLDQPRPAFRAEVARQDHQDESESDAGDFEDDAHDSDVDAGDDEDGMSDDSGNGDDEADDADGDDESDAADDDDDGDADDADEDGHDDDDGDADPNDDGDDGDDDAGDMDDGDDDADDTDGDADDDDGEGDSDDDGDDGEVAPVAPFRPSALSPTNGAVNVVLSPLLEASEYEHRDDLNHSASAWQVDVVVEFDDPVWQSGDVEAVEQQLVPLGYLLHEASYYWRVRYQDSGGRWSEWSEPALFSTEDEPEVIVVPEQPLLIEPVDGATDVSLTPMLRASAYVHPDELTHVTSQWQVDVADDFSDPVWDSGQVSPAIETLIPADRLAHQSSYYWRVRYRAQDGLWSDWSEASVFTTVAETSEDGRQISIENFTQDTAGWTSSGRVALSHRADGGQDGEGDGVLVAMMRQLAPPLPFLSGSIIATDAASQGSFVGDLSVYENAQIRFDFLYQGSRPTLFAFGMKSGDRETFVDLPLDDAREDEWSSFVIHLSLIDGWYVESEEVFQEILSNVESIRFLVETRASATIKLDNVELVAEAEVPLRPFAPIALLPMDGATNVVLTPTLQASDFGHPDSTATHAASEWQIAQSEDFGDRVWQVVTSNALTEVSVPDNALEYDELYVWRVRYRDNAGQWSAWSAVFDFTTEQDPEDEEVGPPDTPTLVSPEDRADNQSLTPLLRASAYSHSDEEVVHAHSQWQVARDAAFSDLVWDSGERAAANTQIHIPSTHLAYETTYYWRVRYRGDEGPWSDWSLVRSFTTLAEVVDPGTDEWYPADGQMVESRRPVFAWPGTEGATWYRIHLHLNGIAYLQEWIEGESQWQPLEALPAGSYVWQVQSWSSLAGFGEWSDPRSFTIVGRRPTFVIKHGPFGRQLGSDITYRWDTTAGATHYHLFVQDHSRQTRFDRWYEIAEGEMVTITLTDYEPGDYSWGVRPWGPDGNGYWNELYYFTIVGSAQNPDDEDQAPEDDEDEDQVPDDDEDEDQDEVEDEDEDEDDVR